MFKKIEYFLPTYKQCWVIVFFMCVVGSVLGSVIVMIISTLSGLEMDTINPLLTYLLPMVPPFLYILYKGQETERNNLYALEGEFKEHIRPAVPLDKTNFGKTSIFIFILICCLIPFSTGIVFEPLTSWIEMPQAIKQLFEKMMQHSVWSVITIVIAAPIVEEFFLRGIMARGLLLHTTPAKAILWSAFFFAFIHMNPWQAVPAFATGAFLGWVYWKTHSLKACIFIHFTNNGLAALFAYLYPDIAVDATAKEILSTISPNIYPIAYLISALILILSVYYLYKTLPTTGFAHYTPKSIEDAQPKSYNM